jgi:cystathionine gamma-synthase
VVTRELNPLFEQLRLIQTVGGAIPSPFDCWLTLRGLQTLALRVRAQSQTAQAIAHWLDQHSAIEAVLYPGLEHHPGHGVAQQQMAAYGGVLSVLVKGDRQRPWESPPRPGYSRQAA